MILYQSRLYAIRYIARRSIRIESPIECLDEREGKRISRKVKRQRFSFSNVTEMFRVYNRNTNRNLEEADMKVVKILVCITHPFYSTR